MKFKLTRSYKYFITAFMFMIMLLSMSNSTIAQEVNVTHVATYNTAGVASDVVVRDNYAYIANYITGLLIMNVTDPGSSTPTSNYDTAGYADGVAVSGNFAYVADDENGLVIVDISDPLSPELAGSYNTSGYARNVAISGNYAYVADLENGLVIVDVTNPSAPRFLERYDAGSYVWDVAVSGNYAYLAAGINGLVILNITDPSVPTVAGIYNTDRAYKIVISDTYAYLADDVYGLVIIDVSDTSSLTQVGFYNTTGADTKDIAVSGSYAYVLDRDAGLFIVDISAPAEPILSGSYDTAGSAWGVAVSGNYVYVADGWNGLVVLQVDSGQISAAHSIGVYNNEGTWALWNTTTNSADIVGFGWAGTEPVVGDWNGDGITEVGIYNRGGNNFLIQSDSGFDVIGLGWAGVTPVVGDWNGDGADEVGVYNNEGTWALWNTTANSADIVGFGWADTEPVVGDWDGDGVTEVGIYNRGGNNFLVQNDTGFDVIGLGWDGITPVIGIWITGIDSGQNGDGDLDGEGCPIGYSWTSTDPSTGETVSFEITGTRMVDGVKMCLAESRYSTPVDGISWTEYMWSEDSEDFSWKSYAENGKLMSEMTLKDGKMIFIDENGNITEITSPDNDDWCPVGTSWKTSNPTTGEEISMVYTGSTIIDGLRMCVMEYTSNNPQDEIARVEYLFSEDGETFSWKSYYANGAVHSEMSMKDGVLTMIDENGVVTTYATNA